MNKIIFILSLLFSSFTLFSQQRITGKVLDAETKDAIYGAGITIKSSNEGTTSNIEGVFELVTNQKIPLTLVVNYVGYKTQEIEVYEVEESITLLLNKDYNSLEQVVVIGYGTQKRKEITGAVAVINGDAVKDIPVQSFEQALQGQAAGVSISLPTGVLNTAPIVRVRGINSISLSSYPLVVVDGVPVTTGDISSTHAANNPLSDINPSDIESIDILKDAASTAIYGSRASAGVILITTKQGKQGRATVSYDGWLGVTNAVRVPEVLDALQYISIKNEAIANRNEIAGRNDPDAYFPQYNPDGSLVDTKWRDYIYRTAVSHNHTASVSGGTDKVNYYFSTNYSNQEGFLIGNDFDRKSIRFNLDNKVTNWLRLTGGASYSINSNQSFDTGSLPGESMTTTGATRLALVLPPNIQAYNDDGAFNVNPASNGTLGKGNNTANIPLYNPVSLFALTANNSENSHFNGNIAITLNFLNRIELKTLYALDRLDHEDNIWGSPNLGSDSYSANGSATNISDLRQHKTWTNTFKFDDRFNKIHHVSLLLGSDLQTNTRSSWGARATQASDDFFKYYQGGWGNITASGNSLGKRVFVSFFSRISYDFKDKYYITGNFRRDGNSALAVGRKYGNFGGISAGWLLSEESFFKEHVSPEIFSDVKLNVSWGRVGNGNLSNDYSSYDLYSASLYGNAPTWAISQQGNPDLSWETSDQTNAGLNFNTLKNRLHVEFAYFNNNVNRLILNTPQSPSKGIPGNTILANVGSLYNRGIELSLSSEVISRKNLSWNISFNYTYLNNKVTALAESNEDIIGATGSGNTNITSVGESIGSLYGLKTLNVNPDNGRRIFLNAAGEQVEYDGISAWYYLDGAPATALTGTDYYILGNALPKWYGGLNSNLRYKDFELNLRFTYSGGHNVMNRTRSTLTDQIFFNNSTDILRRWTAPGQITDIPRVVNGDRISFGGSVPISGHVEKGDFLRLQNVTFAYNLPSNIYSFLKITSVRVYGQITNAFLLTKYTGVDPEVSANGNSNTTLGVEYNTAGLGRTFTLGINVKFN
ncbi:MAG: SusC/RagA family TonB-linked outer membrane protein [Prevotellaceae bacterium]|jgi:TonB-linked SusC/RagA family outer membrane protein|nr:SusC/RagA family TonB-linked outer membrane protein [Prevotellaceae bacterium]